MKKILTFIIFAGLLSMASGCTVSKSQKPAEQPPVAQAQQLPSKEEMMAKWQEFSTPGAEHKLLNQMVGSWDHTAEFWMEPGAAPEKTKGKSDIKWVLGNRYLEQNVSGKSMGQPFTGKGILGYDKANNEYRTVWYDSMGTGLMIGKGKYDAASRTITETGTGSCPFKGEVRYRAVTTFIDPAHFRYEMFMEPPAGTGEMKVMNIEYAKRKKA